MDLNTSPRRAGSADPGRSAVGPLNRMRVIAAAAIFLIAVAAAATYFMLPSPSLDRSRGASVLVLASDGSILRGFLTGDGKWRLSVAPVQCDPPLLPSLVPTPDPPLSTPILSSYIT